MYDGGCGTQSCQDRYDAQAAADAQEEASIALLIDSGLPGHQQANGGSYQQPALASVTATGFGGGKYTFSSSALGANSQNVGCDNHLGINYGCDTAYSAAECAFNPTSDCLTADPGTGVEPTGFAVPPPGLGSATLDALPFLVPGDLLAQGLSKLLDPLAGLLSRGGGLTQQAFQAQVQRLGQKYASQGFQGLKAFMTPGELRAYFANPARGSRFLGTAVHRAVADDLISTYGEEVVTYSPNLGPDFTYVPGGFQVELTTVGQLADHQAKAALNPAYGQALFATYSW